MTEKESNKGLNRKAEILQEMQIEITSAGNTILQQDTYGAESGMVFKK